MLAYQRRGRLQRHGRLAHPRRLTNAVADSRARAGLQRRGRLVRPRFPMPQLTPTSSSTHQGRACSPELSNGHAQAAVPLVWTTSTRLGHARPYEQLNGRAQVAIPAAWSTLTSWSKKYLLSVSEDIQRALRRSSIRHTPLASINFRFQLSTICRLMPRPSMKNLKPTP